MPPAERAIHCEPALRPQRPISLNAGVQSIQLIGAGGASRAKRIARPLLLRLPLPPNYPPDLTFLSPATLDRSAATGEC